MKAVIVGAGGQVGRALLNTAPPDYIVVPLSHAELDITDKAQISSRLTANKPEVVINAAAFTAVDRAETDRDRAYELNGRSVSLLAEGCAAIGARLIHVSTDYVFDGKSSSAYDVGAATHPINVYGASKQAGEQAIAETKDLTWAIVRTSWVYAPWGNNFLLTMLRLMRERGNVSVVGDQIGTPTSALTLSRFLWKVGSLSNVNRILHYTDAGVASWYDFAVAINEEAVAAGLLHGPSIVTPIVTAEYPTPAKRPPLSVLSTRSSLAVAPFDQPHWRTALREIVKAVEQ